MTKFLVKLLVIQFYLLKMLKRLSVKTTYEYVIINFNY